jgi:hypothetical protein
LRPLSDIDSQISLALWDHDTASKDDYCSEMRFSLDSPDVMVINYRCGGGAVAVCASA